MQINFEYQELLNRDATEKWDMLNMVRTSVQVCEKCPALVSSRQLYPYGRPTFGFGNPNSPLFFIGEAPGKYGCGTTGIPFTRDRSGVYFQKILREELGMDYSDIWITNIVKCCPLDNRTPTSDERDNCYPYLALELSIIQPYLVVPLGLSASKAIFPGLEDFKKVRTQDIHKSEHKIPNTKIPHHYATFPIWHPAFVLRTPSLEEPYRNSFKGIEKVLLNVIAIANAKGYQEETEGMASSHTIYRREDIGEFDRDLY